MSIPPVTLITACYNLSKYHIGCRPLSETIDSIEDLLKIPCYLIIFCGDSETFEILNNKRNITYGLSNLTKIIKIEFEDLYCYRLLETVKKNREIYYPTKDARTCSESHLLCCNKFDFVLQGMELNPFNTLKFGWIDAFVTKNFNKICDGGYSTNMLLNILNNITDKFHIQILNVVDKKFKQLEFKKEYYNQYRYVVCGGLFTCSEKIGKPILKRLVEIIKLTTLQGYGHGEEMMYLEVLDEFYDQIERGYGDYKQILNNFLYPQKNIEYVFNSILQRYFDFGYYRECYDCSKVLLKQFEGYFIPINYEIYMKTLYYHYVSSFYCHKEKSRIILNHIFEVSNTNPYLIKEFEKYNFKEFKDNNKMLWTTAIVKIYPSGNETTPVSANADTNQEIDKKLLNNFKYLIESGIDLIVYCDSYYWESIGELVKGNSNITLKKIEYSELRYSMGRSATQVTSVEVSNRHLPILESHSDSSSLNLNLNFPVDDNPQKNTLKFHVLMNNKVDLVKKTIVEYTNHNAFGWIDIGIFHIIKDKQQGVKNLKNIQNVSGGLHIAGIKRECVSEVSLDKPCWRFCGGIFYGNADNILNFHKEVYSTLDDLVSKNQITWEVNVWAMVEANSKLNINWYQANHDDSIIPKMENKLILILMIKNESKIITRLLDSVINKVDGVCITDTGSTDNTIEIINNYFENIASQNSEEIPFKIYINQFENFGKTRSKSFKNAVDFAKTLNYPLTKTWGLLLDADMILKWGNLNINELGESLHDSAVATSRTTSPVGYKLFQCSPNLEHPNTRIVKLSENWICTGATHEYWEILNKPQEFLTLDKSKIYISDIGDGGCKSDKFERDIRLLKEDLIENPRNPRSHFYIAQSYHCLNKPQESIEWYTSRIELGGWWQEIWYSMYQIQREYLKLGDITNFIKWGMKAWDYSKYRVENLYLIVKYYRELPSSQYLAYHYYLLAKSVKKPQEALFLETKIYDYLLDYEGCILNYYVNSKSGLQILVNYLNKEKNDFTDKFYNDLHWYTPKVGELGISENIGFSQIINNEEFVSSSVSKLGEFHNFRMVNYKINPDGSYSYPNNKVKTINKIGKINNLEYLNYVSPNPELNIIGLEDLRLFNFENNLHFTATEKQGNGKIRVVMGEIENNSVINKKVLEPPKSLASPNSPNCEKNWLPVIHNDKLHFIYNYHPLSIGVVDSRNELNIVLKHQTPKFWQYLRGSSVPFYTESEIWFLAHCVNYTTPRKYYHCIVVLNKSDLSPKKYSLPFVFFGSPSIEYCLSFDFSWRSQEKIEPEGTTKREQHFNFLISRNDRDSTKITVNSRHFVFNTI